MLIEQKCPATSHERWLQDPDSLQSLINTFVDSRLRRLQFPAPLETHFEAQTGEARAFRLWSEGLVAIVLVTFCLLLDCVAVHDARWSPVVWKLFLVAPIALVANEVVRRAPPTGIREGAVALAICSISTTAAIAESALGEGGITYAHLSIVICALFGNVVMRLRFPFAVAMTVFLFVEGTTCAMLSHSLQQSERSVGLSLSALAMSLTLIAAYSLEKDERLTFLLQHSGELKNKQIAESNRELLKLAQSDVLTGIPNRRLILSYLEEEWARAQELRSCLSIIVIDVDHFKKINDSYGHPYGDEVLRRVGALLASCLHSQRDMAARYGGEEFMVLLPDTNEAGAMLVAERIRALVRLTASPPAPQHAGTAPLFTTVSCGVCSCLVASGLSSQDLIATADAALYDAKAQGRDCVRTRNVPLTNRFSSQSPTRKC